MIEKLFDYRNRDKVIKYGVISLGVVVILIIAIVLLNGKSYKTPIKGSIKLLNQKIMNEESYIQYYTFDSYYDYIIMEEKFLGGDTEEYKGYIDDFELEYGSKYKIKYDIARADKVDNDTLNEISEAMKGIATQISEDGDIKLKEKKEAWDKEDLTDKQVKKLEKAYEKYIKKCSDLKVTEAYEVDIECKIKGSGKSDKFEIKEIIIAKINGQWMIYSGHITPGTVHYLSLGNK